MTPPRRDPDRVPRRSVEPPRRARAAQQRRYTTNRPVQSTKAVTAKLATLGVVATLAIGGLIAAQMATGKDPALGPKVAKRAKKASTSSSSGSSGGSTGGAATDPYAQAYGDDGTYGSSSGYSSGSSGYSSGSSGYSSGSGYSTQQSAPAPVTSSTS